MSPWWSLCTLYLLTEREKPTIYLSHARWSIVRDWVFCCCVPVQYPLFVDSNKKCSYFNLLNVLVLPEMYCIVGFGEIDIWSLRPCKMEEIQTRSQSHYCQRYCYYSQREKSSLGASCLQGHPKLDQWRAMKWRQTSGDEMRAHDVIHWNSLKSPRQ